MKIGILTYHCVPNFGAQLQTLSTVGFLRKLGHEPIVINWYPNDLEEMYRNRVPDIQISIHDKFCKEFLPITHLCRTEDEVVKIVEESQMDAIIHGSDALFKYQPEKGRRRFVKRKLKYKVFNPSISVEGLENNLFWGGYLSKLRRKIPAAVYAVSSQNCQYQLLTHSERKNLRKKLSNFCVISARDEWTQQMVCSITHKKNIEVFPDPVFSFEQNNTIVLPPKQSIIKKFNLPEKYILLCFRTNNLTTDYIQAISDSICSKGFCPVAFPMPEGLKDYGIDKTIALPIDPIEWYCLIKYSSGYIGERMHPIVVCLHNSVPFFSFDEYGIFVNKKFSSKATFQVNSSKTYQIIEKADMKQYYYSYKQEEELPNPMRIVDLICSFDVDKCSSFAFSQHQCYDNAMQKVLNCLSNE